MKEIDITYRNDKGKVVTRTIINPKLDYVMHSNVEQWVLKATCYKTSRNIVIPLAGVKFEV